MRVLVAESDLSLRVDLCVWLTEVASVELAGLARNRTELLPAVRVSNAHVVVVDWDLLAPDLKSLLGEVHSLHPIPRIIVIGREQELSAKLLGRGVDAIIYRPELPDALYKTLLDIRLDAEETKQAPQSPSEQSLAP